MSIRNAAAKTDRYKVHRGEPGREIVTELKDGYPVIQNLPVALVSPPSSLLPSLIGEETKAIALSPYNQIAHYRTVIIRALNEAEDSQKNKPKKEIIDQLLSAYNLGLFLPAIYKKLGFISSRTLYRWQKEFDEVGIDGLIPQYGTCGKSKITDQEKCMLLKVLLHQNRLKIGSGILLVKEYMKDKGIPSPSSISTLRRFINDFKQTHYGFWTHEREGDKAFNDKCLPYSERGWRMIEVGDLLVADGHRLNFDVINPYTGKKCRPTIVMFWDFKSLYPLGWEIMLEENIQCISSALRNSIITLGKIPKRLLIDNGKAFKAKVFTSGIELDDGTLLGIFANLDIHVRFAMPYNPQEKLEALWGMLDNWLERLIPSYRGNSIEDKPAYLKRNEKDAQARHNDNVPKIKEVTDIIFKWREFCIKHPVKSRDGLSRKEIFESEKGPGVDPDEVAYLMMAKEVKTVHRNGITWNGWHYYDEALSDHLRTRAMIRYSHADYRQVYVYDLKGKFICIARPIEKANPIAWDSEAPADREAYQRMNAVKRKCRRKVFELREMLDEKAAEALPWKQIIGKDPDIVKTIEKIEAKKPRSESISPFVDGVTYGEESKLVSTFIDELESDASIEKEHEGLISSGQDGETRAEEAPGSVDTGMPAVESKERPEYKPPKDWSDFNGEWWEMYGYLMQQDPATLTQEQLEFIDWYRTTSEYRAVFEIKPGRILSGG